MNKFRYILAVVLVALCGCEQDTMIEIEENETIVPSNGYIFFDTEKITRGVAVQNYLQDDFHVLGYKYQGEWSLVKPQASQNTYGVFDNKPQLVAWDENSGSHSYTPMKEWDIASTYSFFAWYPKDKCTCSGVAYEGNPYIIYTLDKTDPTKQVDVLTACVIDRKVNLSDASSKSVSFMMKHRVSALDVIARSYVNATTLGLGDERTAQVKINAVNLAFSNLLYDKVKIPLNTNDANEQLEGSNTGSGTTLTFNAIAGNRLVNYYNNSNDVANLTYEQEKTMFLIPQAEELSCTLTVNYDIVNENGISIWDEVYATTPDDEKPNKVQTSNVSIRELVEGRYYYLLINVTKSGISVVVLEAEAWDDQNVEHEFE